MTNNSTPSQYTSGRELDALVAEKVMGLRAHPEWAKEGLLFNGDEAEPYSTSIEAAWLVVEHLRKTSHLDCFSLFSPTDESEYWFAHFCKKFHGACGDLPYIGEQGDTAPHSICLAALKTLEIK